MNADGHYDTSFGVGGLVTFGGTGLNQLRGFTDMAVQADGKLVFTGNALTRQPGGSAAHIAVARLLSDGTLDPSFDTDGRVTVDMAGAPYGYVDTSTFTTSRRSSYNPTATSFWPAPPA